MFFIYLLLLIVIFFSQKGRKNVSKEMWFLAFVAGCLMLGLFIYHALSPLEINL